MSSWNFVKLQSLHIPKGLIIAGFIDIFDQWKRGVICALESMFMSLECSKNFYSLPAAVPVIIASHQFSCFFSHHPQNFDN